MIKGESMTYQKECEKVKKTKNSFFYKRKYK